jgi:phytoene dehydrogenase-like protein
MTNPNANNQSWNSEVDVVVIGSGIAGLSCAALLAKYGCQVTVCESHTIPGGAAHSFERDGFKFDSGPSLHSGLSYRPSSNPLKHVLDAIGEELPCELQRIMRPLSQAATALPAAAWRFDIPAVAGSGMIAANTLAPIDRHLAML